MIEAVEPKFLWLRAKGRPLGTAKVILRMTPVDGGTSVEIEEDPDGSYALLRFSPLLQVATKVRNAESLMRLEELALR